MKKMLFNKKCGLLKSVLNGKKTMTRRDAKLFNITTMEKWDKELTEGYKKKCIEQLTKYKVNEVVAIAQSYQDAGIIHLSNEAGWNNAMFTKTDLMPHHIKITNIRMERLQDISEEDCLKEGIYKVDFELKESGAYSFRYEDKWYKQYKTAREAFADLIDKVSGRGTWEKNPWVFIYEFDLVD